LDAPEVAAAQPCFYFDSAGNYVGPPELVQGVDIAALRTFCLQTYQAGYFDLPLCDAPATVPPQPSCIDPELRRVLRYCRDVGFQGDDRAANYFCWFALKAPAELAGWEAAQDCPPGQAPTETTVPTETAPTAPTAEKSSAAVPLLIGAAVVGAAAVYFLS
jgi:hypothetical protein